MIDEKYCSKKNITHFDNLLERERERELEIEVYGSVAWARAVATIIRGMRD